MFPGYVSLGLLFTGKKSSIFVFGLMAFGLVKGTLNHVSPVSKILAKGFCVRRGL